MKTRRLIIAAALTLALGLSCLTGCGAPSSGASAASGTDAVHQLADGGILVLSVNPEIAIEYDANGFVTGITARNDDAMDIIRGCDGMIGQETRTVVTQLVTAIGEAGYFIDEIEGEFRQIIIEIESGSTLPTQNFLNDVANDVKNTVSGRDWNHPDREPLSASDPHPQVNTIVPQGTPVNNGTDYGFTDYNDTDYGPNADGVTDYDDTDYGPNADGVTDFDDTDYGPNADGVTDYDDTDYGPNADGVTDYDDTDYGPNADGVTDYDDSDYDNSNYDNNSDYGNSDYDNNSDYGNSDYGSDYD